MFFVLDENNNKIEALDKEGVFAALEKAIADGSLTGLVADSAFVSKLRCCVSGQTNKIAFVTEAKYNEMVAAGTVENGVYYYITDDSSAETIDEALKALDEAVVGVENRLTAIENGTKRVPKATNADKVNGLDVIQDENGVLKIGGFVTPTKKTLWQGEQVFTASYGWVCIDDTTGVIFEKGKTYEIETKTNTSQYTKFTKVKICADANEFCTIVVHEEIINFVQGSGGGYLFFREDFVLLPFGNDGKAQWVYDLNINNEAQRTITLCGIYEIIE